MNDIEKRWTKDCKKFLVGKRVKEVRFLTVEEANEMDWSQRPLVIVFDDGSYIFPSQDDEGNNGGSLFTSDKDLTCIPVLSTDYEY